MYSRCKKAPDLLRIIKSTRGIQIDRFGIRNIADGINGVSVVHGENKNLGSCVINEDALPDIRFRMVCGDLLPLHTFQFQDAITTRLARE